MLVEEVCCTHAIEGECSNSSCPHWRIHSPMDLGLGRNCNEGFRCDRFQVRSIQWVEAPVVQARCGVLLDF